MEKFTDTIKVLSYCGFCANDSHKHCKGMIRNGDLSLVQCPCECFETKTPKCTECDTTNPEHLGRPWLCDDRQACATRVRSAVAANPETAYLQGFLDKPKPQPPVTVTTTTTKTTTTGCLCCGATTKGGRFLPGHDLKWLAVRIAEVKIGTITKDQQLAVVVAVSHALAMKMERRLNGDH